MVTGSERLVPILPKDPQDTRGRAVQCTRSRSGSSRGMDENASVSTLGKRFGCTKSEGRLNGRPSAVPSDLGPRASIPSVKRWAIFGDPSGTARRIGLNS